MTGQGTGKKFCRATAKQRIIAGAVLAAGFLVFTVLWLAADGRINLGFWLNPCGFRQKYGLPCPTCGITTSAILFVQGKIFQSFYTQPAGAVLCSIMAISAFLAFITAVFGVYFRFLEYVLERFRFKYIVLTLAVIILIGWLVTLARALSEI